MRQQVRGEPVHPAAREALQTSLRERLGRHLEGELGEHEGAQGPTRNVDPFPERIGPEEHCVAQLPEALQEPVPRALALHQQAVSLQRGPVASEAGATVSTGVDDMSQLVADLSRQIAEAIRALPPPEEDPVALEEESVTSEDVEGH